MRFLRRLVLLAVVVGIGAAIMRRFQRVDECGPQCDCSQGAAACSCGHATCLAPAAA